MADGTRKLIVGLGNPEPEYTGTRHNVGRYILNTLQEEGGFGEWRKDGLLRATVSMGSIGESDVILMKSDEYMNNSGLSVSRALRHFNIAVKDVVVIHDDIDIRCGDFRVSYGRGHAGHNGVRSIIEQLGSKDFIRVRVGIGFSQEIEDTSPRAPHKGHNIKNYVLNKTTDREKLLLSDISTAIMQSVVDVVLHGVTHAMNTHNGVKRK